MSYQINVSKKQAQIISSALDLYSRIEGGQFSEILYRFGWNILNTEEKKKVDSMFMDLKKILTREDGNGYKGITQISDDGRIAYDMHQVIRHCIATNTKPMPSNWSDWTVDFNKPSQYGSEPLCHMEKNKKNRNNELTLSIEGNEDDSWRFSHKNYDSPLMDDLNNAIDDLEIANFKKAKKTFSKIIKSDPYFIDAYSHLGLLLMRMEEYADAESILKQGLQKAESVCPANFFKDSQKLIWGILENRPYLRCLSFLGFCYLDLKEYEKSLPIFERILSLNPNDNQGIRSPLMQTYLKLEQYDRGLELVNNYQEDILVCINYGRILLLYKLNKQKEARSALKAAVKFSPKVMKELLKKKHTIPKDSHDYGVAIGSDAEAYEYWKDFGEFWTSDILKWLEMERQKWELI